MPTRFLPRLRALRLTAILVALAAPAVHADDLADIQKLMKSGQYPQALEKTDAYIAGKPRDAQGRFMKGLILTEMNRQADAIAVFTRLTEDYPELPEPYNNLAVLYAQQRQYDKARTALEMAIRTHPAYAIAYENLGDVYARLASQAYDKALQLDSSNAAAQGKLSLIRDLVSAAPRPGGKTAVAAKPAEPAAKPAPAKPEPAKVAAAEPAKPAAAVVPVAPPAVAAAKPAEPAKAAEAAKPAEKPAAKPADKPDAAAEAEAVAAVQSWAAAWSKKDVRAYLAHYAPDFQTPKGVPRKDWEAERRQRIDRPGRIEVGIDGVRVSIDGDKATVRFRQAYKSASLNSTTGKTLVLVRVGGKWLIQQERVG